MEEKYGKESEYIFNQSFKNSMWGIVGNLVGS